MRERSYLRLFLMTAALAACATPAGDQQKRLNVAEGEGVAFFSVSHDREAGVGARLIVFRAESGLLPQRAASLPMSADVLKEASGAIYIAMFGRIGDFDDGYGQLHVLSLPAGKHRLDRWVITHGMTTTFPTGTPPPLEFTVHAGTAVYLGNLHGRLHMGKTWFNQAVVVHAFPEIRDLAERDIALFRKKHRELSDKVQTQLLPQGAWGDPARVQVRTQSPQLTAPPVR